MPEERDIEKALRTWAKRRRENAGAPVELHPATRKLLQAEISRLKGAPRHGPGLLARWLWGSPLRLALNLSAVAVLLFAAAVFIPRLQPHPADRSGGPAVLAENNREFNENPAPMSVPSDKLKPDQAAPAVELEQALAKDAARKAKSVSNEVTLADNVTLYKAPVASAVPGAAPPLPAAEPVPGSEPLSFDQEKLVETKTDVNNVPSAPAKQAAVPVQNLSWMNASTNADRRDGFITGLGAPAILNSFRTEQSGDQLRVIDADGSVYAGSLTDAAKMLSVNGMLTSTQSRPFRVSGTNVTRNLSVVFTGTLISEDQSSLRGQAVASGTFTVGGALGGGGGGGIGGRGTNRAAPQSNSALFSSGVVAQTTLDAGALPPAPQFRVQGSALVGTNEIQINAVPVTR
jgi:hypothetical protein